MSNILLVVTRDVNKVGMFGRAKILKSIFSVACDTESYTLFRVKSLLEQKCYVTLGAAFSRNFVLVEKERRWPLQCILFDDAKTCDALETLVKREKPTAIYFDTVRCFALVQRIARKFPQIQLICDFDDLMSRRMRMIARLNETLSTGYLGEFVPVWMRHVIESKVISKAVLKHEANALTRVEAKIARLVRNIVLLSPVDADTLRDQMGKLDRCEISFVFPPFAAKRPVAAQFGKVRFVFIGSDRQLQNRLSIRILLSIWSQNRIIHPLYIYGQQSMSKVKCANVYWPGFAQCLEDVYTQNSILIAPAGIGGGVKTKILEALEFGVIPLGNEMSFEGIAGGEHLAMSEEELVYTLTHLQDRIPSLVQAAQLLQDRLTEQNSVGAFRDRWMRLFSGNMEIDASESCCVARLVGAGSERGAATRLQALKG